MATEITFTGTLGTTWGPIAIAIALRAKGEWETGMVYSRNDLVQSGADLYLVRQPHTSYDFEFYIELGNLVKAYRGPTAEQVSYDNLTSGLASENLQAAIDEVVARVAALEPA